MHVVLSTDFRVFLFYWGSCGYRVDAKKNQINTSMKEALLCHRGLVSKETVVLRRWGSDTRKFCLSTELIM